MRPVWAAALAVIAVFMAATRPAPPARGRAERRRLPTGALTGCGALAGLVLAGPVGAVTAAVATTTLHRWRLLRARRARQRAATAAHADGIDLLVLAVRAGHLPAAAVRVVLPHLPAPLRPAYAAVVERLDAGRRFADAVTALVDHLGHPARPVADALAAAEHYGLPLGPVLDRLADEARHQRRRAAEAEARRLPVRLAAPLVLCTLPSFVLLAIVPLLVGALSSLSE